MLAHGRVGVQADVATRLKCCPKAVRARGTTATLALTVRNVDFGAVREVPPVLVQAVVVHDRVPPAATH